MNKSIRAEGFEFPYYLIGLECSSFDGNRILESLIATSIVRYDSLLNILLKMQETCKLKTYITYVNCL